MCCRNKNKVCLCGTPIEVRFILNFNVELGIFNGKVKKLFMDPRNFIVKLYVFWTVKIFPKNFFSDRSQTHRMAIFSNWFHFNCMSFIYCVVWEDNWNKSIDYNMCICTYRFIFIDIIDVVGRNGIKGEKTFCCSFFGCSCEFLN